MIFQLSFAFENIFSIKYFLLSYSESPKPWGFHTIPSDLGTFTAALYTTGTFSLLPLNQEGLTSTLSKKAPPSPLPPPQTYFFPSVYLLCRTSHKLKLYASCLSVNCLINATEVLVSSATSESPFLRKWTY